MNNQLPPGLAEAIGDSPDPTPPSDKLREIQAMGRELHTLQSEIEAIETDLKSKKSQATVIVHKKLPDLLGELHLDRLGLTDVEADIVAENYYKANISAEWDEDRRERAFKWLEDNGFGSLVKHEVTYSFRKGEENKAHWLTSLIEQATLKRADRLAQVAKDEGRDLGPEDTWDIPAPVVRKNVPHSTLTSLVRSQTELPADNPSKKILPLEILGAVVGRIVKIKPRSK